MRIVLTGGGSGGHVFPLVAVAKELKNRYPDVELLYIGTKSQMGDLAEETMKQEGIPVKNIFTGKLRRYFSFEYFLDIFRFPLGIIQSLFHLLVYMPDAVFSKGGYASVPVVLVAWLYRIPVLTHESDSSPGWANRVSGKFCKYIAISYPETQKYFLEEKVLLTGNPIRKELLEGSPQRAYERWKLNDQIPVIFVIGGSQGSRVINRAITRALKDITKIAQVVHMTGQKDYQSTLEEAGKKGFKSGYSKYRAVAFLNREEMADMYSVASLVISRAGANTITEIAANKLVSILIPMESHDQPMNAFYIAKKGGALVLEETNLGQHILVSKIEELLRSATLRKQMSENIANFYHPDAAEKIVDGILKMLRG